MKGELENMIGAITEVWTSIMTWITTSLSSVQVLFYAEDKLTFLGTLAVVSVGIGVVFLLVGVIQNFLKLRG